MTSLRRQLYNVLAFLVCNILTHAKQDPEKKIKMKEPGNYEKWLGLKPSTRKFIDSCFEESGITVNISDLLKKADSTSTPIGAYNQKLLKISEAAKYANVSRATIMRRIHDGSLDKVELGPSRQSASRITAESFDAWLTARAKK